MYIIIYTVCKSILHAVSTSEMARSLGPSFFNVSKSESEKSTLAQLWNIWASSLKEQLQNDAKCCQQTISIGGARQELE